MINKIRQIIKQFDLFGVELNLNMKSQDQFRTCCGGFTSLILVAFLSFIFTSRLINVIQKDDYTIKVQTSQTDNPSSSVINGNTFMFAIKLDDPLQNKYPNISKTSYNITMHQFLQISNENGIKTKQSIKQYKFEKCTLQHFEQVDLEENSYIHHVLEEYLCLPMDYELLLKGSYNTQELYYPKILISLCQNQENCYSEVEIESVINTQIKLSTIVKSTIFLANSTNKFLKQIANSDFYLQSDFSHYLTTDLFLQHNKVLIDDNLLSVMSSTTESDFLYYQFNNFRDFSSQVTHPDVLFEINLRLSSETQIISRITYRFDQFLSYLGGMLKFFSAFIGIFAVKYNLLSMRISLANSLYQFNTPIFNQGRTEFSYDKLINYVQQQINRVDDLLNKFKTYTFQVIKTKKITQIWSSLLKNQLQNDNEQFQKSTKRESAITQQEIDDYQYKLCEYKENFFQNLIQKIIDTRKILRLGTNYFIYLFLCCNCFKKIHMTRSLLIQCEEMIRRDLDIVNILSKIQQIDKLKTVLLDQDQRKVFNYIPKPVIFIDKNYQIVSEEQNKPNNLIAKANQQKRARFIKKRSIFKKPKQFFSIYNSYLKLRESNTQENQRLIKMLGPMIEIIFEKYNDIQQLLQTKEDQNTKKQMLKQNQTNRLLTEQIGQSDVRLNLSLQLNPKIISDDGDIEF